MNYLDFFKRQAKNFKKDYDNRTFDGEIYSYNNPKFFSDIDDIIVSFDIDEYKPFTLMNAQHIIALLAGFNKWESLIHSDEFGLELGKLLLKHRNDWINGYNLWDDWDNTLLMNNMRNWDNESKLQYFKERYINK